MEKLELKHLAAYLPYGLKCQWTSDAIFEEEEKNTITELTISDYNWLIKQRDFKPILRPLSDLTKEIEVNGEKFVPIDWFEIGDDDNVVVDYGNGNVKLIGLLKDMSKYNFIDLSYINYGVVEKLFEWHFDVFGLIKQNLAIDINKINKS